MSTTKDFDLIYYKEEKQLFLSCLRECNFSGPPTDIQFQLESKYRKSISDKNFQNLSFAVKKNDTIEAIILCHLDDGKLTYNSRGVEVITSHNHKKLLDCIFNELKRISKKYNLKSFCVNDYDIAKNLSPLGQVAYNNGGIASLRFEPLIDLTEDEKTIHQNIRKSYKSLINWGEKEISFSIINKENPDKEKFQLFRSFHKKISGRVTRPIESWNTQFEMIKTGCAELIIGELPPHNGIVSSTLCIDHGHTTFYGVAVYDRNLFDKPLAHASLYKSIIRAKDRGQKKFSMGIIFQKNTTNDKEYNIGAFKKGFCDKLSFFIEWTIPLKGKK